MRRLVVFLSGMVLMLIMFASLFLSGAIYDTGKKTTIETFFFLPDDTYEKRPSGVASPADLGYDSVRDMLISKYVTEFFYCIPEMSDVESRMSQNSSLALMSGSEAFDYWLKNVAPEIRELAERKVFRTVAVTGIEKAVDEKNYWIVDYDLITWERPNDFSQTPVVTHGQIYLNMFYEPGLRTHLKTVNGSISIEDILESGNSPALAFKFGVWNISTYKEITVDAYK